MGAALRRKSTSSGGTATVLDEGVSRNAEIRGVEGMKPVEDTRPVVNDLLEKRSDKVAIVDLRACYSIIEGSLALYLLILDLHGRLSRMYRLCWGSRHFMAYSFPLALHLMMMTNKFGSSESSK